MIAAYISEYEYLETLGEGEIFMAALKFYGEEFENQIKSIRLKHIPDYYEKYEEEEKSTMTHKEGEKQTSFISLEETYQILRCEDEENYLAYNIQANPLRIVDPINNRIMSGSCYLYPQIKSEFRRIYK